MNRRLHHTWESFGAPFYAILFFICIEPFFKPILQYCIPNSKGNPHVRLQTV